LVKPARDVCGTQRAEKITTTEDTEVKADAEPSAQARG